MRNNRGALFFTRARTYIWILGLAIWVCFVWAGDFALAKDLPDVRKGLKSGKAAKRLEAAEKVFYGRGKAGKVDLEKALRAELNPHIRLRFLEALSKQEELGALPEILRALKEDSSPMVRQGAAGELGRLAGGEEALSALSACSSKDPDAGVRKSCVISLGLYRSPELAGKAVRALGAAGRDQDPEVRSHVAFALSRHPDGPEVRKALDALERDAEESVRESAKKWRGKHKK